MATQTSEGLVHRLAVDLTALFRGRLIVTERTVLDAAMAQSQPPRPDDADAAHRPPPVPTSASELDQARRTSMAAERTWLAWWRTSLAASAARSLSAGSPRSCLTLPHGRTCCSAAGTRLLRSGS